MKNTVVYAGKLIRVEEVAMPTGHMREVVRKRPAVAVLVYDPECNTVAMVRQLRAPFMNRGVSGGYIFEVPAGHVETGEFPEYTAVREVKEEIGVEIRHDQVQLVTDGIGASLAVSPGWTDEHMWLAYVELEPGQRNATENVFGEAQEGERTEVSWTSVAMLESCLGFDDLKTFALVQWFLTERRKSEAAILRGQLNASKRRIEELQADLAALHRMDDRF